MLWVAAFLALIIWALGLASDFLGFRIHLFLLFAIFCCLLALLPGRTPAAEETAVGAESPDDPNAKSVPAADDEFTATGRDSMAIERVQGAVARDDNAAPPRSGQ